MKHVVKRDMYRLLIHPVISITLPFLFVFITVSLLGVMAPLPHLGAGFFIFLLLVGVGEVSITNLIREERAERGNGIRHFIIMMIITYGLFSLLGSGPLSKRFFPTVDNVYPTVMVALFWVSVFGMHSRFLVWELFRQLKEKREGEALRQHVRDSIVFIVDVKRHVVTVRKIATTLLVVLMILYCAMYVLEEIPGVLTVVATAIFLIGYFFVHGVVNAYIEEFYFAGEGIKVPGLFTLRRLFYGLVLMGGVVFLALLVSSNRAVLPVSLLQKLLDLLSSLFDTQQVQIDLPRMSSPSAVRFDEYLKFREMFRTINPDLLIMLRYLFQAIKQAVIAAGLSFAAMLIFGPLFSKTFRNYLRKLALHEQVLEKILIIGSYFKMIVESIKTFIKNRLSVWDVMSSNGKGDETDENTGQLSSRHTWIKRREMDRLSKQLAALFTWSRKRGFPYRKNETLEEYCSGLLPRLLQPESRELLVRLETIYREARYSPVIIGRKRRREFAAAVQSLIKHGKIRSAQEQAG